ncbi:MAG: Crp/Fnr family transcriptional regulator [Bacteroidetes bacterium]|nr:Crp/Fnr family transcriptional regulator [Bacteroidota bacterium]
MLVFNIKNTTFGLYFNLKSYTLLYITNIYFMSNSDCAQDCFDCTKKLSMFNVLKDEELAIINESKNIVKFRAGEIILKQGTVLTHLACLTSGLAKIYIEGENNKNLILKFLRPTQMVGGPGLFTDFKIHFTVKALEESSACFIDTNVFKQILNKNHEFTLKLLWESHEQTIRSYTKFINLTQRQMHGRIADALLHLSQNIFVDSKEGFLISRQDLADYTGMAKESAIRILREFSIENMIILNGKKIIITQPESLDIISRKG